MKLHSIVIILLTSLVCLKARGQITTQHELVTKNYLTGAWGAGVELNYFRTQANYSTEGGSFEALDQGKYFQNIQVLGLGYYNFTQRWRLWTGGAFAFAQSFDSEFERTNSELKEVQLGTSYIFKWGSLFLTPEAKLTYALNEIDPNTDSVMTGEGAHQFLAGTWAWRSFGKITVYSSLHVQYLTDGRSTRLPYALGAKTKVGSLNLFASLNGSESIVDDDKTDNESERVAVTDRVNGGSFKYYAVNPSWMEFRAGAQLPINLYWAFNFGGSKTFNGSSSAEGYALFIGVQLRGLSEASSNNSPVGASRGRGSAPKLRRKRFRPKPEDQFKIKQEEYDESLFQDEPSKKKPKQQPEPNVNDMLDDTMKELE